MVETDLQMIQMRYRHWSYQTHILNTVLNMSKKSDSKIENLTGYYKSIGESIRKNKREILELKKKINEIRNCK